MEKNFHIFQILSIPLYCLSQLSTLQVTNAWIGPSEQQQTVLFICTPCWRCRPGETSGAAEVRLSGKFRIADVDPN